MIIANKYKIIEKLGNGEYGTIFKGENIRTKEFVAIKMEPVNSEIKTLKRETQIYQYLGKAQGIPTVKWYGTENNYNFMVLPLLGKSLTKNIYSLDRVLLIGKEIIKRLEFIHSKGLIHRDVKPANLVYNLEDTHIYIIDFGFCKKYKDDNDKHIDMKICKTMIGTPNYVSVSVHNKLEPSRRDDLESVGYIMIFLLKGYLEWDKMNEIKMKEMKENIVDNINYELCIRNFISYCRNLKFDETPDYDLIYKKLNIF